MKKIGKIKEIEYITFPHDVPHNGYLRARFLYGTKIEYFEAWGHYYYSGDILQLKKEGVKFYRNVKKEDVLEAIENGSSHDAKQMFLLFNDKKRIEIEIRPILRKEIKEFVVDLISKIAECGKRYVFMCEPFSGYDFSRHDYDILCEKIEEKFDIKLTVPMREVRTIGEFIDVVQNLLK